MPKILRLHHTLIRHNGLNELRSIRIFVFLPNGRFDDETKSIKVLLLCGFRA